MQGLSSLPPGPTRVRKVCLYIAASLDGYLARPDGSVDWLPTSATQDYGYGAFLTRVDTIVMGRKTYDQSLSFGPWPYAERRCVVFSRARAGHSNDYAEFVAGDVAEIVAGLKASEGQDIWLVGGSEIVAPCLAARVVDEVIVSIPPLLLGEGIPLFQPIARSTPLSLRDSRSFPDGLVQLTYDVVG